MNKRANLSTLLFVILVFVVCLTALFAFAKHRSIINSEIVGIDSITSVESEEERVNIQLKILGEQAVFYAYNNVIQEMSSQVTISEDNKQYIIFDKTKFNESKYLLSFKEQFSLKFKELLKDYPAKEENFKSISDYLNSTLIEFDGKELSLHFVFEVNKEGSDGVSVTLKEEISRNFLLSDLGLSDLNKVSKIDSLCSLTSESRIDCISTVFPGFKFVDHLDGYYTFKSEDNNENKVLVNLISKKSYFTGSGEPINFTLSFIIPANPNKQEALPSID